MRVLVTRTPEDGERVIALLAAQGHEGVSAPLLNIEYLAGEAVNTQDVQALLFTSTNGVRAFAKRSLDRSILALCVGDRTAAQAKAENFTAVLSAKGNVEDLATLVTATLKSTDGVLLHPAGTKVAGNLSLDLQAAGFTYRRTILYAAHKAKVLPEPISKTLQAGDLDGVLLYSPRTAQAFSKLVLNAHLGHTLSQVSAYCLSPAVADQIADLEWKSISVAAQPNQDALLALL